MFWLVNLKLISCAALMVLIPLCIPDYFTWTPRSLLLFKEQPLLLLASVHEARALQSDTSLLQSAVTQEF